MKIECMLNLLDEVCQNRLYVLNDAMEGYVPSLHPGYIQIAKCTFPFRRKVCSDCMKITVF